LATQFPAVLILGARQCGKTTLARAFLKGEYFDFERPSDLQVFLGDPELALRRFQAPIIIDEAQTLPEIFPILRAMIDEKRAAKGRFFLLGSVNPALIKQISESLAGRVGVVELTPFLFAEAKDIGVDLATHWLRGGFPDACSEGNAGKWKRWQENYVRMFIERDLLRHGVKLSHIQTRRLMTMLAHQHGQLMNASELGRSLGITYHTVNAYLDLLEGHYLCRRLTPYYANVGKRLVKSPKVYIRDSGVFHYLLGISDERQLLESPYRGNSWEGYMVEQLIAVEQLTHAGSQFFYYRTHAGAKIDLLIDRGHERIGFEFKCALSVDRKDWANLKGAVSEAIIKRGYVVYLGDRTYRAVDEVEVVSAAKLIGMIGKGLASNRQKG
jgi:hypothetical protein